MHKIWLGFDDIFTRRLFGHSGQFPIKPSIYFSSIMKYHTQISSWDQPVLSNKEYKCFENAKHTLQIKLNTGHLIRIKKHLNTKNL